MSKIGALEVKLHEKPIGTITLLEGDRTIFSFKKNYIDQLDRPVLGLNFKDTYGQLMTDHRVHQTRLMPFFSNLLPEGPLRTYLANLAGVKSNREFFLLAALGKDLPGAITVHKVNSGIEPIEHPERITEHTTRVDQNSLRFSLAGVQLKFSAIMNAHGGLTIPAQGVGGSWIIKLPSAQYAQVPENEFSMMTLARLIGIDVPEFQLMSLEKLSNLPPEMTQIGGNAFVIHRFDRTEEGQRIHIEDFAQIFGLYPEDKYYRASARNIADVIANECSMHDVVEFIKRLVFNTLIGNADMHLKNWSLIYPDRRNPRIAPAYDFVSTIPYINDSKAALKVSRSAEFGKFTQDELIHLAHKAKLPEHLVLETARETIELFQEVWGKEAQHLPINSDIIGKIENHMKTIPLLWSS